MQEKLQKMANWKAPGPDGIHTFWLKQFASLHNKIAHYLQQALDTGLTPNILTQGRTVLIQKDPNKGTMPTNYCPITCLPTLYKLFAGIDADYIYEHITALKLFSLEQKECHRQTQGCK